MTRLRTQRSCGLALLVVVLSCGLTACSRKLTASTAKDLLQERIDANHDGALVEDLKYVLDLARSGPVAESHDSDAWVQSLVRANLMEKQIETRKIPALSGEWSVTAADANRCDTPFNAVLRLDQNGVNVRGAINHDAVEGEIRQNGTMRLKCSQTDIMGGWPLCQFEVKITQYPGRTELQANCGPRWRMGEPVTPGYLFASRSGADTVEIRFYTFRVTRDFQKEMVDPTSRVKVGRVIVDSVEQLLLDGETSAVGRYTARLDRNAVGEALNVAEECAGEVRFGKQPDGGWIAVQHTGCGEG